MILYMRVCMQVCRKVRVGAGGGRPPRRKPRAPGARRVPPAPVPVSVPPTGTAGPYPGDEPQDGLRLPDEGLRVEGATGFPRSEGAPVHGGAGVGGRQAGGSAGGAGLRRTEPGCAEPRRAAPSRAVPSSPAATSRTRPLTGTRRAGSAHAPLPPAPPLPAAQGEDKCGAEQPGIVGLEGAGVARAAGTAGVRTPPGTKAGHSRAPGEGWGRCHSCFLWGPAGLPAHTPCSAPVRLRLRLCPVLGSRVRNKELLERVPQRLQR